MIPETDHGDEEYGDFVPTIPTPWKIIKGIFYGAAIGFGIVYGGYALVLPLIRFFIRLIA